MHPTIERAVPADIADARVAGFRLIDRVMPVTKCACGERPFMVVNAGVAGISDAGRRTRIGHDVDEAIGGERGTGLRHQGRITATFMLPVVGVVASVAFATITPGFEPRATQPVRTVPTRWDVFRAGRVSTIPGHAILTWRRRRASRSSWDGSIGQARR